MRQLFILATVSFWLAVLGLAASHAWLPAETGQPLETAADQHHSLAEVARHESAEDCWMAIKGEVYDLSGYLPEHPSDPEEILAWCGREGTQAYLTKGKSRAHSARADSLLAKYRIATLQDP